MRLYNSLTASKELFTPPTDRPVTLYVCGVTPYDTTHVGHARTFLVFDLLIRYLRWHGTAVRYCQNVTDVDDPLFARAERDGIPWRALADREVAQFVQDCAGLNLVKPDFFPFASGEIEPMMAIIAQLIAQGHAYAEAGNVYFSVRSDPQFGAMARMTYDEMLATANQRGNDPTDPLKRDPLDFVLWKTGNPGDPTWASPWGRGRPGWHIECSAMATRYLGPQLDIHGGGRDLLFPHHPCEIAQTEPVTGKRPFAHFWLHTGLVWLDGEKMSKSLGNLIFVRDALREYAADTLRWYLLTENYREDFCYERRQVPQIAQKVQHVTAALRLPGGTDSPLDLTRSCTAFAAALDDDLDTPHALTILSSMASEIHAAAAAGRDLQRAQALLGELCAVVGFQISK